MSVNLQKIFEKFGVSLLFGAIKSGRADNLAAIGSSY